MGVEISEVDLGSWPFDDDSAEEKMKKKIEEGGLLAIKAPPPEYREPGWQYKAEAKAIAEKKAKGEAIPTVYAEQVKKGEEKAKAKKGKGKAEPEPVGKPEVPLPPTPVASTGINWKTIGLVGGGASVLAIVAYLYFSSKKRA